MLRKKGCKYPIIWISVRQLCFKWLRMDIQHNRFTLYRFIALCAHATGTQIVWQKKNKCTMEIIKILDVMSEWGQSNYLLILNRNSSSNNVSKGNASNSRSLLWSLLWVPELFARTHTHTQTQFTELVDLVCGSIFHALLQYCIWFRFHATHVEYARMKMDRIACELHINRWFTCIDPSKILHKCFVTCDI